MREREREREREGGKTELPYIHAIAMHSKNAMKRMILLPE